MRILIFLLCLGFASTLPAQQGAVEICDNGIDDDGDGLIDCADDDCTVLLFSNFALGNSASRDVALGDLDADGDLDAWVANSGSQPNLVWINQGGLQGGAAGDFADSGQALGSSSSQGVSLGDLDGDGDLDAWVANNNSQANRVWINLGGDQGGIPGNFADSGQALGNYFSIGVSLGDLDGDGDLDAWVANSESPSPSQPNRVWINQGGVQGGTAGNFLDSGQALGNSESEAVALGDLDGDGDLDAWVANHGYNSGGEPNLVWLNQGGIQGGVAGNFADSGQALGNSTSYDVSLGDLDGDGDLDAWVANVGDQPQPNRVWINQGGVQGGVAGNFSDSGQALGSSTSAGVSLGDLDGDGDLDAWVVNCCGSDKANRVWINQGGVQGGTAGDFLDSGQAHGNSDSVGVSLGDLDGDGDLDAWVANSGPDRVYMNLDPCSSDLDGDGIPNACDIDQTGGDDCDMNGEDDSCQVDSDNDGLIDPCDSELPGDTCADATPIGPGIITVDTSTSRIDGPNPCDENLTNDMWFLYTATTSGDTTIETCNSTGTMNDTVIIVYEASLGCAATTTNCLASDDDGCSSCGSNNYLSKVTFSVQLGESYFVQVGGWNGGTGTCDLFIDEVAAEINCTDGIDDDGDGLVDCEDSDCQPGAMMDSGQRFGTEFCRDVALGDLDNDGDLDAFITNNVEGNKVWTNSGGITGGSPGEFYETPEVLGYSGGVDLGDLDGDGDLDAFLANDGPNQIWVNQGNLQGGVSGIFLDSGLSLGNTFTTDVKLADLDNDGDLDVLVNHTPYQEGYLEVLLNQGGVQSGIEGEFNTSGQQFSSESFGVDIGDLDGDGDLDLFVTHRNNLPNKIWFNAGGLQGGPLGTFIDSGQSLGSSYSWGVSLGDIDGDGDLDAFVINENSQPNRLWINLGDGQFQDSGQALGECDSHAVELGDLDKDGDLDAFVANQFPGNRVWINSGGTQGGPIGLFIASDQLLGESYGSVSLGDLDGDLDLDALVVGTYLPCAVLFNRGVLSCNDIDGDGIGNECDIDQTAGPDCDSDGQNDNCQVDSDSDGTIDPCDDDLDGDGIPNYCDGDQAAGGDCDGNGALDSCDIDGGAPDCDANGTLDTCDLVNGAPDCDSNAVPDTCQPDSDSDGTIDPCDDDIDGDGIPNDCDVDQTAGADCDMNGQDDSCQDDTDSDGTIDTCDDDIDGDGIPNSCDIDETQGADCDIDGQDDSCQPDTDSDGTIDPCDDDLDGDGFPNDCDIDQTAGADCDRNGQDDNCQTEPDADGDGIIDPCDDDLDGDGIINECDLDQTPGEDCNENNILDSCEIAGGAADADANGIPDECEESPFSRGDANADGGIDIGDAIATLAYLFTGGTIPCDNAADSNDDGLLNIADGIALLGYLFNGATPPPAPFGTCGMDPTADALECDRFGVCP